MDTNTFWGGMIFGVAIAFITFGAFVLGTRYNLGKKAHVKEAEEREFRRDLFERSQTIGETR